MQNNEFTTSGANSDRSNGNGNGIYSSNRMPSFSMDSSPNFVEMPSGEMNSNPSSGQVERVLIELRVSNQRGLITATDMAGGINLTGLQIDTSYEPVTVSPTQELAGSLIAANDKTVILRGAIAQSQIAELEAQPNVVKVYKDTPIAAFNPILLENPQKDLVAPTEGEDNCPIGTCDCSPTQAKGGIADVAQYLGIDQIWAAGYKGEGIVVGVVDGGITAEGRPVEPGETPRRINNVIGGSDPDWGTKARSWGEHGNMCATDVLGMAPDAKLYDCRLADGDAISNALRIFEWSIKQHQTDGTPHILTNSWGIYQKNWDEFYATNPEHPFTRKVVEAIEEGILVLFAAGNCGGSCPSGRCGTDAGPGKSIWGANGHPLAITVGAVNKNEEFVGYSSQGPAALDPQKPDFCSITHFKGYFDSDNGTSAATPIAAGVMALLKQAKPDLTQEEAKIALKQTAKNIGEPGFDQNSGAGIIQPLAALETLVNVDKKSKWSEPYKLDGNCFSAPAATTWGENRLDTFVMAGNSAIYHKTWDGKTWGEWENLGGFSLSAPAAVSSDENKIDLFIIGQKRSIQHKSYDCGKWSNWKDLEGICQRGIAATASAPNRLDLFSIAADNAVWYKYWDGSEWSRWHSLGGFSLGAPAAVSTDDNHIDVFIKGNNHAIYHKHWDGKNWSSSWENLGGLWLYDPAVTSCSSNHINIFAVGTDNAVYRKKFHGSTWREWENIGGTVIAAPAAATWGEERLDTFLVGCDNALYHRWLG
ncbi:MAG: S8 family serine peptidase [Cyanobacteria bacterium P01_A01_bin.84]